MTNTPQMAKNSGEVGKKRQINLLFPRRKAGHVTHMTPQDFRLHCIALAFTAIVTHEGRVVKKDATERVKTLADMIEEFCREAVPEAFSGDVEDNGTGKNQSPKIAPNNIHTDKLIDRYKREIQNDQKADLPPDYDLLMQLYDRLHERHRLYATENHLADDIERLLQEEILFDSGVTKPAPATKESAEIRDIRTRMAEAIANIIETAGDCAPHDLKNFTRDEITRHWPMAYALAKTKLPPKDS